MVLLFHASTELLEASLETVLFAVFCKTACCSPGLEKKYMDESIFSKTDQKSRYKVILQAGCSTKKALIYSSDLSFKLVNIMSIADWQLMTKMQDILSSNSL